MRRWRFFTRGLSLAEGSKDLRMWEWLSLLEVLFAERGRSEVSKRVAHGTIAANLEEVPINHSKTELSKHLIGVADDNEFSAKVLVQLAPRCQVIEQ